MNERIAQIAKKAGINLTPAQFSGVLEDEVDEFELEKFVELLLLDLIKEIKTVKVGNQCTYTTYDVSMAECVKIEIEKFIKKNYLTTEE